MRVLFAALGAHAPWYVVGVAVLCATQSATWALVDRRRARPHRVP